MKMKDLTSNSLVTKQRIHIVFHWVKSVQIRSFYGLYFPVFGLNMEIYSVNLLFSLNTGKYGSEKTPYLGTIHAVFI